MVDFDSFGGDARFFISEAPRPVGSVQKCPEMSRNDQKQPQIGLEEVPSSCVKSDG